MELYEKTVCSLILPILLSGCIASAPAAPQKCPPQRTTTEISPKSVPAPAATAVSISPNQAVKPVAAPLEHVVKPKKTVTGEKTVKIEPSRKNVEKTVPQFPRPKHTKNTPKPHHPNSPEKFRRGAGLWQAFARLSPKEQRDLMRLQRQDPEKFRMIMQEKIDLLYEQERARRKEFNDLAKKYRETSDLQKKQQYKNELRQKLRMDFNQRLQDSRRDLEANRKRLNRMEAELKKREKNRDAIVEAILDKRLSARP